MLNLILPVLEPTLVAASFVPGPISDCGAVDMLGEGGLSGCRVVDLEVGVGALLHGCGREPDRGLSGPGW